jgi:hypothetical protein
VRLPSRPRAGASFVIRHSSFVIRHSSFVIRHSSFVIRHSSFVIRPPSRHSAIPPSRHPARAISFLQGRTRCRNVFAGSRRRKSMLFIIPLVIFIVGYALALWFSATGRRLVRRFFFLPVLVSLAVTLWFALRFEHHRFALLSRQTVSAPPDSPVHFLPLYALRLAPLILGICVILNAATRFTVTGLRRRWRRAGPSVESDVLPGES